MHWQINGRLIKQRKKILLRPMWFIKDILQRLRRSIPGSGMLLQKQIPDFMLATIPFLQLTLLLLSGIFRDTPNCSNRLQIVKRCNGSFASPMDITQQKPEATASFLMTSGLGKYRDGKT